MTKNACLYSFKAWELLMTSAFHEDFAKQEIGLQPIDVNESSTEGIRPAVTQ